MAYTNNPRFDLLQTLSAYHHCPVPTLVMDMSGNSQSVPVYLGMGISLARFLASMHSSVLDERSVE